MGFWDMPSYLQYHNAAKLGWVPLDTQPFLQTQLAIFTRRASVKKAIGSTVFVVVSLGNPRRYYLWESFQIANVRQEDEHFCAWGTGWQLCPPQRLKGDAFVAFRKACANFVGFRAIDQLPYTATLRELAIRYRHRPLSDEVVRFCTDLIAELPTNGDLWYAQGFVRQQLGHEHEARADYSRAIQLGTEFANEAKKRLS
jgi:hypothetical protein